MNIKLNNILKRLGLSNRDAKDLAKYIEKGNDNEENKNNGSNNENEIITIHIGNINYEKRIINTFGTGNTWDNCEDEGIQFEYYEITSIEYTEEFKKLINDRYKINLNNYKITYSLNKDLRKYECEDIKFLEFYSYFQATIKNNNDENIFNLIIDDNYEYDSKNTEWYTKCYAKLKSRNDKELIDDFDNLLVGKFSIDTYDYRVYKCDYYHYISYPNRINEYIIIRDIFNNYNKYQYNYYPDPDSEATSRTEYFYYVGLIQIYIEKYYSNNEYDFEVKLTNNAYFQDHL